MNSAANQDRSGGQFLLLRPVIMRGGLACGHRVSPHSRTVTFISWRWYPEQREGWSCRQLLCFWQSHASVSRGSYVGNACERPPAFVDPPAEVSTSPNHTTKWTVYKYRRSFVCSWSRVCRQTLFIECMAVEAMPVSLIMSGWHLREVDWTSGAWKLKTQLSYLFL